MTLADPLYSDWIHQQVRVQPDQLAVCDLSADRKFSWRQFNDRVDALACRLLDQGVAAGDRIA